jgi:hypothetical protein
VGEGTGGGQRVPTLSTGRAGARQRIVHMSTACGFADGRGRALGVMRLWPVAAAWVRGLPLWVRRRRLCVSSPTCR